MGEAQVEHASAGHVKGRQFRPYNILVVLAMSFASIAMGFSASIIATTLGKTFNSLKALHSSDVDV